jgi:hypothetical protein
MIAVLLLCGAGGIVWSFRASQREANVRERYEQMRDALSIGDTYAARALFAPDRRDAAHRWFDMLHRFAKPLGERSVLSFSGSRATVCPERVFHDGGNTIEMVRVDGEWFFTGGIHID